MEQPAAAIVSSANTMLTLSARSTLSFVASPREFSIAIFPAADRANLTEKIVYQYSVIRSQFLPRDATMLARYMPSSCVCPSVRHKPALYQYG